MSEIQWFVILKGKREGPFLVPELLRLEGVSLETWAWKEGMEEWKRIREIPELKVFFKEAAYPPLPPILEEETASGDGAQFEGLALSLPSAEPPWIFWFIFFLLIGIYALWQFYFTS